MLFKTHTQIYTSSHSTVLKSLQTAQGEHFHSWIARGHGGSVPQRNSLPGVAKLVLGRCRCSEKHLVHKRMDGGVITGAESEPSSAVHSVSGGDAHMLSRTGHSMLLGISGKRVYSLNAALRTSQSRRLHPGLWNPGLWFCYREAGGPQASLSFLLAEPTSFSVKEGPCFPHKVSGRMETSKACYKALSMRHP